LKDDRSIKAVDTAIAFGEGRATREELDAAYATAYGTYADADADAADAAAAAAAAASADAYYDADAYAAIAIENRLQTADICRKYIGDLIIQKVNSITKPLNQ
jgi:hypothetical protein